MRQFFNLSLKRSRWPQILFLAFNRKAYYGRLIKLILLSTKRHFRARKGSILPQTKSLVGSILHFIRDPCDVFSAPSTGTLRRRNLKTELYFSCYTFRPSWKTKLSENDLQTGGIWKRRLSVLMWAKNISRRLKTVSITQILMSHCKHSLSLDVIIMASKNY